MPLRTSSGGFRVRMSPSWNMRMLSSLSYSMACMWLTPSNMVNFVHLTGAMAAVLVGLASDPSFAKYLLSSFWLSASSD